MNKLSAFLPLLLVAAACGGGDDESAGTGTGGAAGTSAGSGGKAGGAAGKAGAAGTSAAGQSGSGTAGSTTAGAGGTATAGTSAAGKAGSGTAGTAGTGTAGTGTAGTGTAGTGTAGTGTAGTGTAGTGTAGTGTAGTGTAGAAGMGAGGSAGSGTAGSGTAGSAGATPNGKWLMGYYPGYQKGDLPPSEVPFDKMSHLAIGAVLPKADGSLDTSFYLGAGQGPALAQDLADRAHMAGRKAILMIGGAGAHDGFVAAAAPGVRATLVANLVSFANAHGIDGFDLDWEPLPESELDGVIALATDLRAAMPSATLTIPVGPINANFETVSAKMATLAGKVDQVNIMTYSMSGAYPGWQSWHHSPLDGEGGTTPTSITSSVDAYLAAGVPAAKLGIGAGFYGLCYTSPVTGPKQDLGGAQAFGDDNQLSYRAILSSYYDAAARKWDDTAKVPYLSFTSPKGSFGCTYLSYVDEQALGEHTAYVKQKGLGGMIVWTINEGHLPSMPAGQRDPLLAAMAAGLQ